MILESTGGWHEPIADIEGGRAPRVSQAQFDLSSDARDTAGFPAAHQDRTEISALDRGRNRGLAREPAARDGPARRTGREAAPKRTVPRDWKGDSRWRRSEPNCIRAGFEAESTRLPDFRQFSKSRLIAWCFLAQTSLPRSKVAGSECSRVNRRVRLSLDQPSKPNLPFGLYPPPDPSAAHHQGAASPRADVLSWRISEQLPDADVDRQQRRRQRRLDQRASSCVGPASPRSPATTGRRIAAGTACPPTIW